MRSVTARPDSLRRLFTSWIQSSRRPSRRSSSSSVVSRATVSAVLARDGPALAARRARPAPRPARARGRRRGSVRRRAPRTRPARADRARRAAPAPSFGPSTGRFGFTCNSDDSTSPNATSFTRSSSAISSTCFSAPPAAPATTSRLSGWRSFSCDVDARLAAELDDPPGLRRSRRAAPRRRSARLRPAGEVHRRRPVRATRVRQRWSVRNGSIGAITRSDCTSAYQSVRNAASSSA